jgi:integrase
VEPLRTQIKRSRGEYVFERKDSIRTAFENACGRAKLRGVTPHTLRHTFASRLAMAGVGNKTLQDLGRWKRVEMVDRYAHLSPEHLAQAIEKIGQNSTTVFTTVEIQNDLKVGAK